MKNKKTDMKNRFADTGKSYAGYFLRFVFYINQIICRTHRIFIMLDHDQGVP